MSERKKISFTTLTLAALFLGIAVGILIYNLPSNYDFFKDTVLVNGIFLVLGNGFIRLLKMLVVPLVFVSLVSGTCAIGDVKKLGKIGSKTIVFYLITTTVAIGIALVIGWLLQPGLNLDMSAFEIQEVSIAEKVPFTTTILNFIPDNPIAAMANGDMIPIIVFAIFVGAAISTLGDKAKTVTAFFNEFNDIMMAITMMVMKFAPIGVFCLVAKTFSVLGFEALLGLIKYLAAVFLGLGIHCFVVYALLLFAFTKLNPFKFFKKYAPAMAFAFSTSSSNATIPVSIETLDEKIGVSRSLTSFTVPLGATINMDGTAIMQGVAVMFTAQAFGMELSGMDYLTVIATATLASIGTAGVPGVGLVMLSLVLSSVGLPIEAIGIIMGVDRLVDMTRTAVNVTGDAVCSTILAYQEKSLDIEKYNA